MADLMSSINNVQIMRGFSSNMSIGSFNQNILDYRNIDKLDDFTDKLNGSESSTMLKGAVEKIQNGDQLVSSDFEGMTNNDLQLAKDLQHLTSNNSEKKIHNSQDVVDGFSKLLNNYLDNVDNSNKTAEKAVETFATGGDIDIHTVMIASEKAGLQMQLAMQMKNKLVQAYQEIKQIRV